MATDPVIKDHQLWLGFVQPEGLVVSPHALKNAQAVLTRNVTAQQEILRHQTIPNTHKELQLKDFPSFTQEFWGWRQSDVATPPDELSTRLSEYGETLHPTWVVAGGKGQPDHLILIQELASGTGFDKSDARAEQHLWQAPPQARFERLLRDTGVSIGLLVSPSQIRLVYSPKGETSGHITFPIHQMTMAANWPMLAALHLLLHSDRLFIGPESQRLPAILEATRRYQNEVSIRLAGQVLRALNELVRGFQEADRAAHGRILDEALRHDPNHLYGGMLTTLMRMVFVLYAEDRRLMGSDETWLQNYSISGLYERLRADVSQYPDTMDSRYGAWANIITLTRLLYDGGGHGSWRLPPRHGGLFDPDAFPFLEGRPWESKRAATALVEPPLLSDGIIFRILQDLLYLEGERISYRALDVEQIGSVYEAMMGFTIETAHGISIGLGSEHLVVNLEDVLTEQPPDRHKWLKEHADCEVTGKAIERMKSAASVDEILTALRRRISKLYLDQNSNPVTVPKDGLYLQPTEERRRSGSHYTPRSLTQPIVKTTLDPVLAQLGDNPTSDQILSLKICDPAMGSGAFLVEACRYLGEKLEKAWIAHGQMPPIPADQDPLLHARRIVAQRCIYGVDKNPFAVNLAKLSLWLATFAGKHPFTFVDHTIRCGDSLVGLTAHQIEAFHWHPKEEGELVRDLPSRLRHILDSRAQILDAADETPYETLAQKLAVTEEQMIDVRCAGDLIIAAFFNGETPTGRDAVRKHLAEKFRLARDRVTDLSLDDEILSAVRVLKAGPKPVNPFHWELEFPEVFARSRRGFDAMVGNPPFLHGKKISGVLGECFCAWLKVVHPETIGNADLVAYFFRVGLLLVKDGGTFGFLATKTIREGDTRQTGLRWICRNGGNIYSATRRIVWVGAAVIVSAVHVKKGAFVGARELDGRDVPVITAYLFHKGGSDNPDTLSANASLSFQGSIVLGMGFTFDDTEKKGVASPLAVMRDLIRKDSRNRERIFPYIGGEELNKSPTQDHHRFVIDFGGIPECEARAGWPDLMAIVERKVKPERMKTTGSYKEKWWQFGRRSLAGSEATAGMKRFLVTGCGATPHLVFAFMPEGRVLANSLDLFPLETYSAFCALQSRPHEVWARFFASSMKDDLRYTPSDCFETFPFPEHWQTHPALEDAGEAYYEFRHALMILNNEGLTKTYNRFHNPDEHSSDILKLRGLHDNLDRAVLNAYGWTNLQPRLEFILDYEDEQADDGKTSDRKKPWRYRWIDEDRDEVLARLLELNHNRAKEEAQSVFTASATRKAVKRGRRSSKSMPVASHNLFEVQEPTE